MTTTVVIEP